ncbi:MAG: rod shape-determining protein MreD [Clostridia bacterium]|nr:rod shape-determining protein MreD [Clostridia bacterium]
MSMLIKLCLSAILACVCQTNLSQYIRIAGVAPDMLIVILVALTSYTGAYGGFCTGALTAMLYDASVGYVLAINMVAYTFIGWAAPMLRGFLNRKLKKLKHKSVLVMMLICFFLTLMREVLYIGYLFLIGSEQSLITLVRALLCSGYSALMILPGSYLVSKVMRWRLPTKKKHSDLNEKPDVTAI